MLHELETVAEMEVAELRLRFALEVTTNEKIRSKHVRGTAQVRRLRVRMKEDRLR